MYLSELDNKCTVVQSDVSLEDISNILKEQKEVCTSVEKDESEDAFSKTLRGSKIFLKEQGFIYENPNN